MDLVLFGATGFTGKLVAQYLRDKKVDWALAGRDRAKLEALKRELDVDVPILVGDVRDPASLDAIVKQTKVVCTTVGPYAKYGTPMVDACVRHGVDYCDLTGETQWVRRMIDTYHDAARESGARIVHCCGFDSIPSDLGVWMVQDYAKRTFHAPCETIVYALRAGSGGISGGTFASMLNVAEEARHDRETRRVMFDPYALNPEGERSGPDGPDQRAVAFDEELQEWTAPFVMAVINTRVVRRSHALAGYPYGRSFRYREVVSFGKGPRGLALATSLTAGLGAFVAATALDATRGLVAKVLPKPGEGPSPKTLERGRFEVKLVGHGKDFTVRARVGDHRDPGYRGTAVMLAESAMCLARDGRSTLGGVMTPAYAMGGALIERLRRAGMTFEVTS